MTPSVCISKQTQDTGNVSPNSVDNSCLADGDYLLRLVPAPNDKGWRPRIGKVFTRQADGSLKADVGRPRLFIPEIVPIRSGDELHRAVVAMGRDPVSSVVVAGGLADPSVTEPIRRLKGTTVVDRATAILTLDNDKWPNTRGFDPRVRGHEAAEWMRSFMPPALRAARISVQWSSSCCVGAPEGTAPAVLSAAFRFRTDARLVEAERVALMRGINAFVLRAMRAAGIEHGDTPVDARLGFCTQVSYVSPPRMPRGEADPLGDARLLELPGAEVVDLAQLRSEIVPPEGDALPPERTPRVGRKKGRPAPPAQPSVLPMLSDEAAARLQRPGTADVIPLPLARALGGRIEALKAPRQQGTTRRVAAFWNWAARLVLDMVALAQARAAWGAEESEFRAWHEAGGVPDGQRNAWMLILHSTLCYALGGGGVDGGTHREAVKAVAGLIIDPDWIEERWFARGGDSSVADRLARSLAGERCEWNGKRKSLVYGYRADTIRTNLGIHERECEVLGLASLGGRAFRRRVAAREAGRVSAERIAESAAALRARAAEMRAGGATLAEIARACDRSPAWASSLKLPEPEDPASRSEAGTETLVARAQRLRDAGGSLRQVGMAVGRSAAWVGRRTTAPAVAPRDASPQVFQELQSMGISGEVLISDRGQYPILGGTAQGNPDSSVDGGVSRTPVREVAPAPITALRPSNVPGWANATVAVPQSAPVRAVGWDRRGRIGRRCGVEVWISPGGVAVRRNLLDVAGREALFGPARDAALEPRRAALEQRKAREAALARMTVSDRAYAAWNASRAQPVTDVPIPAEPDPAVVPGTQDWWAGRQAALAAVLGRTDWRTGLERFRMEEPLAYAAMILGMPSPAAEQGIAEREARMAIERDAREAAKQERRRAKRAALFGSSGTGTVVPLRGFRPKAAAYRAAGGDRLARFRRPADEWDRRAKALPAS